MDDDSDAVISEDAEKLGVGVSVCVLVGARDPDGESVAVGVGGGVMVADAVPVGVGGTLRVRVCV
ncbi:MAG: hypothetical protein Q8J97_05495, partial [Flavobacteriaceae bacterium]|nr:hypothetical protein [Flavobacteriaceae bacterium]